MQNSALNRTRAGKWSLRFMPLLLLPGIVLAQSTVEVNNASQLQSALNNANNAGGNVVISVNDGTYTLNDTLYVNANNITIKGKSGNRASVVIQGDAMSAGASIGNIIRVAASNFKLDAVTLQRAGWHAIQFAGESNADGAVITNCVLRDTYEQIVKATKSASAVSDNIRIENCLFEYTAGRAPYYYTGGIDAHGARGWVVRGNTFRGIASPGEAVSEFAVHFWDDSANNTTERNTIIDCDRGIGYGLQGFTTNAGGVIRNNMVYHSNNGAPYADVGIALENSTNTQVYNNTVYFANNMSWAMEYRFAATTGAVFTNNLTNKPIQARDGGGGTQQSNVTNASASWFKAVANGDLHLASAVSGVVNAGRTVSGLADDFDGEARGSDAGIDIGADEFGAAAGVKKPNPPTNISAQ
ncbi:MAG: right-handed parallel beta-helix repeat-containing protein [Pseudomonadota bacterium]